MRRTVRAILVLLAGSTFVICGVKGPPHPPAPEVADAGVAGDGGAP
jgi:predicted small lipoprotein YifL